MKPSKAWCDDAGGGGGRGTKHDCALLDRVVAGDLSATAAAGEFRALPYRDLGFARIDHHRALRDALPEVVLGEGETPEQAAAAAREILEGADRVLVTRAAPGAMSR